jgi:hypothetical protein
VEPIWSGGKTSPLDYSYAHNLLDSALGKGHRICQLSFQIQAL